MYDVMLSTAVSGVIQALIGTAFYKLVQRQEQKLDHLVDRVTTLEDKKIAEIENRITGEAQQRRAIHERINGLDDRYPLRKECQKTHEAEQLRDEKMDRLTQRIDGHLADLAQNVAAIAATVDLLTNDKIKLGGSHGHQPR